MPKSAQGACQVLSTIIGVIGGLTPRPDWILYKWLYKASTASSL